MKLAIIVALVIAAAAGGGWYWYQSRSDSGEVRYRVAKVERGPMAAVVAASGTLNAVTTVQVGSQISGQVKDIYADFNTAVKKGQVIARIDPATFELRVNQTRADLDAAESAVAVARSGLAAQQAEFGRVKIMLADAERDLARKKMLVDKNFMAAAEWSKAKRRSAPPRENEGGAGADEERQARCAARLPPSSSATRSLSQAQADSSAPSSGRRWTAP